MNEPVPPKRPGVPREPPPDHVSVRICRWCGGEPLADTDYCPECDDTRKDWLDVVYRLEVPRYSAQDIHRMREACITLATPVNMGYNPDEVARTAEAMLVTYMSHGTPADELVKHARDVSESRFAARRAVWDFQDAAANARREK